VNVLPRLLAYARPYRARLALAVLAMALYGAASVGVVRQVAPILDRVLPYQADLRRTIALILGFYLLKGAGAYVSAYLMTDVGQRVVRDVRALLFRHILGQSAAFFSASTSGRLMSRITSDVAQVQRIVSETMADLARESITLLFFAGLLFSYHPRLAMLCLTVAPLVLYPLVALGRRVRRTTRRSQEALAQIAHVSAEAFTGHRIVKAFGAEGREASKFERAADAFYRTTMKVTSALSALPPLMELVGGTAFVTALCPSCVSLTPAPKAH
jgi:subfamily B ATP-binding cassette protein MsbA